MSRDHYTRAAAVFPQYPRPVLVDLKAPATGHGYRFDLDLWDPREPSYGWFPHDGTINSAASPEDILQIFEATRNAEFILHLPTPRYLVADPASHPEQEGYGYLWQTPAFYGAMVQYLFGTAGPTSEWQGLPRTLDFFQKSSTFNWANLRARRGHVAPYSVVAVIIGQEPYYIEGWAMEGGPWGAYAEQFRQQIRARGITVPLGLHVREGGAVDDPDRTWFGPMMRSLNYTDLDYIDLHHHYKPSSESEVIKRTYPVAINPSGFQNWWRPQSSWPSDYTRFLWIIEDTRNAIRDFGFGSSDRWKLGFGEHGMQITSNFSYNDMTAALHWALWLSEAMRQNISWDSQWVLVEQGWSHAQIQIRNSVLTRTPGFFVYQMVQRFYGYDLLSSSYSGPMGSAVDASGTTLQFPWTVVRVFRDPASERIHLFVVNQSAVDTATITGFEDWAVVEWTQIHSSNYSDENPLGAPGPEPIRPTVVVATPGQPLVIRPVSINHVVLGAVDRPLPAP